MRLSRLLSLMATACLVAGAVPPVLAAARIGTEAPDFTLPDAHGQNQTLTRNRSKYVVLEWFNNFCPFVRKQYDSGNMQKLQRDYTARGVVWYTILSSAKGKQGYADAAEARRQAEANRAAPTALLLDPSGKVGRLYGAKTTPHLFIVDPRGILIYEGAIDDRPSTDKADIAGARNYVAEALDAALAGKPVPMPVTKSYGCSVKY